MNFDERMKEHQVHWRNQNVSCQEWGSQNGHKYPWILPKNIWEEGLWPGIRNGTFEALSSYLNEKKIQKHSGIHNLRSSWVLCANLYYSHRHNPELLKRFLEFKIDNQIDRIDEVELEWNDEQLNTASWLGENGGHRGMNQTSPDVAFIMSLKDGRCGIMLTEIKFVEKSFYSCPGRNAKSGNPDVQRCTSKGVAIENPYKECHQLQWKTKHRPNRRYWDFIKVNNLGKQTFDRCPAANAYQLFRQTALAEAIARHPKYDFVVNCIAYDVRNESLSRSMQIAGIENYTQQWKSMFDCQAIFQTFTHQEWVLWVQEHDENNDWSEWLNWIGDRYDYEKK